MMSDEESWVEKYALYDLGVALTYIFGVIFVILSPHIIGHLRYKQLMWHGILIDAVITDCRSHSRKAPPSIEYEYVVGGRTYHKSRSVADVSCRRGQSIPIRYGPNRATVSNVVGNNYSLTEIQWWLIKAGFFLLCGFIHECFVSLKWYVLHGIGWEE